MKKINKHAQALGKIKTKKKAKASRENGKLGGRPKKLSTVCTCDKLTIGYNKDISS